MCNGSGRFGSRLKETGTLLLQAEATLIWGDNGMLPAETGVGNPKPFGDRWKEAQNLTIVQET